MDISPAAAGGGILTSGTQQARAGKVSVRASGLPSDKDDAK